MNEKVFETIFVKIELKHDTITCGTIYRLPMTDSTSNQQFVSNLSSVLSHLKPNTKCCMYGDFNYDLLQAENRYTSKFIETMFNHCFYSIINKPTRITSSSAIVLDHVWTSMYSYVIKQKFFFTPSLTTCLCSHVLKQTSIKIFTLQKSESITQKILTTFTIQ